MKLFLYSVRHSDTSGNKILSGEIGYLYAPSEKEARHKIAMEFGCNVLVHVEEPIINTDTLTMFYEWCEWRE